MFTLGCDEAITTLMESGDFTGIVIVAMGCMLGMFGIVFGTVSNVAKTRAREATRRELAAYIAEGTLKPEDAVALLNAGRAKLECGDQGRKA
jgi:hypothetical protein